MQVDASDAEPGAGPEAGVRVPGALHVPDARERVAGRVHAECVQGALAGRVGRLPRWVNRHRHLRGVVQGPRDARAQRPRGI